MKAVCNPEDYAIARKVVLKKYSIPDQTTDEQVLHEFNNLQTLNLNNIYWGWLGGATVPFLVFIVCLFSLGPQISDQLRILAAFYFLLFCGFFMFLGGKIGASMAKDAIAKGQQESAASAYGSGLFVSAAMWGVLMGVSSCLG